MISASDSPTGLVPKVRVRIKALAHLPERPPLDEGEFGLRDTSPRLSFRNRSTGVAPCPIW
jgi:hypothetical protein